MLSLRSGQIGTFYWNVQDGTHFWDDRMHEIWGLKPGTYQGTMNTDFLDSLHPDHVVRVMPSGMSGGDLAGELRRHYQEIKVLMTSGYPEKVIGGEGIDATGITLLRKPYKKAQLAAAVRGALDR